MALIGLYCLATLLFFINIEPFKAIGIFLSICYLPGISFTALGKQDKLLFEDLVLAFPISIGLSCAFTLALLGFGVHVRYVPAIIHIISGTAIIIPVISGNKVNGYIFSRIKKQEILFCLFALLITLLISIPFILGPNRIAISGHALHHSSLVTQIMNGIFPPENPGLGGTIIGYYWGFHALIAAITVKTNFHQIQIMFILNVISLYIIFCISYSFAKVFNLPELYRYIFPIAIIGLMRSDAGILLMGKLISGNLMPLDKLTAFPIQPYEVLSQWISGLPWIDTRLFTLHKLYNVSGMLLAISLCYAYLLILIRRGPYMNKTDMTWIALIMSACFFNYPPLAIFLLFHGPIWSFYIFLTSPGNLKGKISQVSKVMIPYIMAGFIVCPYMLYVIAARAVSSGGQGEIFNFAFYDQSMKNMVVYILPLPIIVYGVWIAIKKLSMSRELFFLVVGTILCLTLTVFTRWPFDNSYKYNYILAIFFSMFFVFALSELLTFLNNMWLKRITVAAFIVFLSLTPIITEASHIISSLSTAHVYSFSGRHILFAQDKDKNEAYEWIRENTPMNALLILGYTETNWPCCGFNNNYLPAAVAERNLYVIKDEDYTTSNPEYSTRVLFRDKLFENPDDRAVIDFFSQLNRPIFLLIDDSLERDKFFIEEMFEQFPPDLGKEFVPVFQNEKQIVYQLTLN